jgi:hypothetical protein
MIIQLIRTGKLEEQYSLLWFWKKRGQIAAEDQ